MIEIPFFFFWGGGGFNLALLEKGCFGPIVLEPNLYLERIKIGYHFVANLSKLMLQNKADKWLNGHHKV